MEMSQIRASSLASSLVGQFSDELLDEDKAKIADSLWGIAWDGDRTASQLDFYFRYYTEQTTSPVIRRTRRDGNGGGRPPSSTSIKTHTELLGLISLVKGHPDTSRKDLKLLSLSRLKQIQDLPVDPDMALDLAVRVMLMIGCRSTTYTITTGQIFMPSWKDTENLVDLVERALPKQQIEHGTITETIRAQKLRAQYLREYAKFKIEWTDNLPDHLFLQIIDAGKSLRIFRHAGFLEINSQTLATYDESLSTAESLKLGCLPPDIIYETLRTILLLFPEDDERSRALLVKEISDKGLDPRLAGPFQFYHGLHQRPSDVFLPENVQSLFEKFPCWGERLYKILKEVEDPTPMTRIEKWSDSKKSPRYSYWAGMIALVLALCFGILATVLGALQVWISYCTWQGDPSGPGCNLLDHGSVTPKPPTTSTIRSSDAYIASFSKLRNLPA